VKRKRIAVERTNWESGCWAGVCLGYVAPNLTNLTRTRTKREGSGTETES
jgi:hypothetical protein